MGSFSLQEFVEINENNVNSGKIFGGIPLIERDRNFGFEHTLKEIMDKNS